MTWAIDDHELRLCSTDQLRDHLERCKAYLRACFALRQKDGAEVEDAAVGERVVALEAEIERRVRLLPGLAAPRRPRLCLVEGHPNCDAQQLDPVDPRSAS